MVLDVAQMLVPGPETGHGYNPGFIIHNDSTDTEVYLDVTPAIVPAPGSTHFVIPPGTALALTGAQTFWAMCRPGTQAPVHVVPSVIYGTPTSGTGFSQTAG